MESGHSDGTPGTGRRTPMTGLPIDQLMKELVSRASEVIDPKSGCRACCMPAG